ncbi:MAG: TIR domain-containing protein [Promethearchaeota archaeon]
MSEPKELTRARQFIKEGKFEESLQLLKDFEEKRKDSLQDIVSCHLIMCDLLLHQGFPKKLVKLAEQTYEESLGLEKSILSVEALFWMAKGYGESYNFKPINKIIKQAEELLATLVDESVINKTRGEAYIVWLKAVISNPLFLGEKGDADKALKYFKHSLALGESLGDDMIVFLSIHPIAWVLGMAKGEFDHALEYAERTLAFCKGTNDKLFIAWGFLTKATLYHNKGEVARSIPLYEKSLAIAKELNNERLITANLNNMADAYRMIGELDHALECSEQCLAQFSENGGPTNLYQMAWLHDYLIQILIEKGDLERAQQYFNHLEQLNNQLKDKTINLSYLYNKALILKESPRISNRGKAEEILKQILEEKDISWELEERALLTLCELLIIEFQMSNEVEVLDELESYVTQLLENAEKSESYWILGEAYLFQAKIALISSDLEKARRLLAKGQQIAEKFGLHRLAMSISEEHDKLLNEISVWEELRESDAPMGERIELARLTDQIKHMSKKRVIEYPKLEAEQPILFAIITKEGKILLSNPFTADITIDSAFFSEFLSSCNTFCDQILSESFDRVKFGQHTVLITAVDSFSICYMFQGQSYSARQKLLHFSEAVKKEPEIMKILEDASSKNIEIKVNETASLEELIYESFLSDPKQFQMPFKAYEGEGPFIFVSYSHTDRLQVYPIIDYLNKTGVNIWYDEGIPISEDWKSSIVDNLERCSAFLVFITPHIIDSEYVRKEISFALKKQKPFFSVYLKETELPSKLEFEIGDIQYMNKYLMPETEFYNKLNRMLAPALNK